MWYLLVALLICLVSQADNFTYNLRSLQHTDIIDLHKVIIYCVDLSSQVNPTRMLI